MQKKIISIFLIAVLLLSVGCSKKTVTEADKHNESISEENTTVAKQEDETKESPTETETETETQESTSADEEETTEAPTEEATPEDATEETTTISKEETPTTAPSVQPPQPTEPPVSEIPSANEIDVVVNNILAKTINSSMTSLEKVVAIHDYITYNVDYDYENYLAGTLPSSSYTAEGALINGRAVCSGYASAFSMLAKAAGFEVVYVSGAADNGSGSGYQGHAWNEIKIDGVWYNLDTTWDDPAWIAKPASDHSSNCYDYFLISDATLGKNHKPNYSNNRCTKDYSRSALCQAIAKNNPDVAYVESEANLKTEIKSMIDQGKEGFSVYTCCDMESAWDMFDNVFKELKQTYRIEMSSIFDGGVYKYYIDKLEDTYIVESQEDLDALITSNLNNLDNITIWYYDSNLTDSNYYYIVNSALIKTGYSVEVATYSNVTNGVVSCTVRASNTNIVNSMESLSSFLNKYSIEEIGQMKFAYLGEIQSEEVGKAVFDTLIPKGGFPLGLYTDISYGVTYINISDVRPVMYVENTDQIAQYVKNNMEAALSTNFVIKTEENNCSNIYFEANEKISAATERYVYSSYYFSNGYMMYMIEML